MKNETLTLEETDLSELLLKDGKTEKPITVCFVCTGNTCRSPMAAAVLNHLGKGKYRAFSAGLSVSAGDRIAENSVKALEKAGIPSTLENPYKEHYAVQITPQIMESCDRVIGISASHTLNLIYNFPDHSDKIGSMTEDIPDPFMYGEEVYQLCLEKITRCIKEMFAL